MKPLTLFMLAIILLLVAGCSTTSPVPSKATPTILPASLEPASSGSETELDSGLFSQASCKPPCWQDLMPGMSSSNDVKRFVDSLSLDDWPTKRYHTYDYGCLWIRTSDKENHYLADFYLEEEKLAFLIWVMPARITLQQIVDYYGEPQYFWATISSGDAGDIYLVRIYYPSLGIAFEVLAQPKDVNSILPSMKVMAVHYFVKGDINSYFVARYSCIYGSETATTIAQNHISIYIQPWSGFGEVKAIPSR